ncbi:MAG: phosphodiester glycosidase family protein, partial [Clostridia bacterium]|nr:phosphodiester glycosidase family protein [Clostridia bacterium]
MGVVHTYAFGPILVENGQLSEYMLRDEYYTYREPRCAIGMLEPHHYFLLVAKGRTSDSKGVYLTWLADKMLEKGVVEGFNLDGGGTAALMFMGKMLNKSTNTVRATTSITGFGNSDFVK